MSAAPGGVRTLQAAAQCYDKGMAKRKKSTPKPPPVDAKLLPVIIPARDGTKRRRPPAITPTVLERLRQAYLIGCDDGEAALAAGIAVNTIYNHQKANPDFLEWKNALKNMPFLRARKTIVAQLDHDPEFAMKYMERKKRAEFAPNAKITIDDQRGTLDEEALERGGDILSTHLQRLAERKNANTTEKQPISTVN